jgi:hypothetical protein
MEWNSFRVAGPLRHMLAPFSHKRYDSVLIVRLWRVDQTFLGLEERHALRLTFFVSIPRFVSGEEPPVKS